RAPLPILLLVAAILLSLVPVGRASHPRSAVASGCGVTQNANGTYTFSPLHVDGAGVIRDASGCYVPLTGVEQFGTSHMQADKYGSIDPNRFQSFHNMFKMNVWRFELNAYWWQQNVYVYDEHMSYRDWVKTMVSWAEAAGNYV